MQSMPRIVPGYLPEKDERDMLVGVSVFHISLEINQIFLNVFDFFTCIYGYWWGQPRRSTCCNTELNTLLLFLGTSLVNFSKPPGS